MESKFRYTDGDTYYPPECDSVDAVIEYIQQLPPEEDPTVFGLHPNAEITFN